MKKTLTSLLVVIISLFICVGFMSGCGKTETFVWADIKLNNLIPEPPSNLGHSMYNSEENLYLTVEEVTEEQFKDYVNSCKEKGFTIDSDSTSGYKAYNEDGYKLTLSHIFSMTIDLEAPMKTSVITWPTSEVAKLLPVPKSTEGKIEWEYSDKFFIYISNTTIQDYNNYVQDCIAAGFTVDYNKGDKYYFADNANGYNVNLRYEGFNIMSIKIQSPSNDNQNPATGSTNSNAPESTDTTEDTSLINGMRLEFKKAMDEYEVFFNDYCDFMKKYAESQNPLSLLADYTKFTTQYTETMDALNEINEQELNDAELKYYTDVMTRINQKLLEVAQ